jgi:hypothetical protein
MSASFAHPITTYSDIISHCDRFLKRRGTAKEGANDQGDIREAIALAYRELPGRRLWSYYRRHTRLPLVASYSTGTVAFDYTGGTYERQLTLSSGTWPEWAVYGEVLIDSVWYRVEDRKSSTVLTLDPRLNPGEDVASGTSYAISRSYYTLPNNFVSMGSPILQTSYGSLSYVEPDKWLHYRQSSTGSGWPCVFTIMGDPSLVGNLAFYIQPHASSAQPLDLIYQARPRPMVQAGYTDKECKGYVTTQEDSISVAGHDTEFTSGMVGSIIRFSANSAQDPKGLAGHNVRVDERTIISVTGDEGLTVDAGVHTALSKVKYSISDPVDIEPGLLACFLRCCEKHVALVCDLPKADKIEASYEKAYILAAEEDRRVHALRVAGWEPDSFVSYTVEGE